MSDYATRVHLHPDSLSPDPLYGRSGKREGNGTSLDVYPNALLRAEPTSGEVRRWGAKLNLFERPPALSAKADSAGRLQLVLDFGTEVEGELELDVTVPGACNLYLTFGESPFEAEGWGVPGQVSVPTEHWHISSAGRHQRKSSRRGFRFVRFFAHDIRGRMTIHPIAAHAWFAFSKRLGDFRCSDRSLQRIWQASLYTARLCTRADSYWDGIKRDRLGWYGDARITQQSVDAGFLDPVQASAMLLKLPADGWANEIPTYSFDAVAMLRQLILTHGTDLPGVGDLWAKTKAMLDWTQRTQTTSAGLLKRTEGLGYFFGIGFLDWSEMPVGGRFEELSWVQFKHIEALAFAAEIAGWLGKPAEAARLAERADHLRKLATKLFWRRGNFVHTLNQTTRTWSKLSPNTHYEQTYKKRIRLGASGPTRHSAALAAWAGLCSSAATKRSVLRTLGDPKITPVITPYFAYYEQFARAMCGDPAGAIRALKQYVGSQIQQHDSACVWESYEPEVSDFRKWGLHGWPKSLCHGWSSGMVGLINQWLVGVRPVAPGYSRVVLDPAENYPCSFEATIPTPHGTIRAVREKKTGRVEYRLPKGVISAGS